MTRPLFHVASVLVLLPGCSPPRSFVRRYPDSVRLTPEQEKIVVQLARTAHVNDIERVTISYSHSAPSFPWITVKERETIRGRSVTYRVVTIGYLPWVHKRDWPPAHSPVVDGFWVEEGSHPRQRGYTILKARGREHRVGLTRELSIPKAEQVLSTFLPALEEGNFDIDERVEGACLKAFTDFRSGLKSMDLCSIKWDGEQHSYTIEFTIPGELWFAQVEFAVEGGKISILEFSSHGA